MAMAKGSMLGCLSLWSDLGQEFVYFNQSRYQTAVGKEDSQEPRKTRTKCSNAGQEAQLENILKYTFMLLGF